MAHFAQLDENNVVTQVIVVGNDQLKAAVTTEVDGFLVTQAVESEAKGVEFCKGLYGADTNWKQTSYNGNFRGKYAGIGDTFDGANFVAPVVETPLTEAPVEVPVVIDGTDATASVSLAPASTADSVTIEVSNNGV